MQANAQDQTAQPQPAGSATPIPPPAWQRGDTALAAKWQQLTGRYIIDLQGRTFALSQLQDKKALVLVFSRAHW